MSKPTKANVPPPPSVQRAHFMSGNVEAPTIVPRNMSAKLQDMSFKVHADFHREFKTTAAVAGLSMKELLEQSFAIWKKQRNS